MNGTYHQVFEKQVWVEFLWVLKLRKSLNHVGWAFFLKHFLSQLNPVEICVLAKIEMAPLILSNVLTLESDQGDTKFHEETCNLKVFLTTMISSFGTTYKALKRKKINVVKQQLFGNRWYFFSDCIIVKYCKLLVQINLPNEPNRVTNNARQWGDKQKFSNLKKHEQSSTPAK